MEWKRRSRRKSGVMGNDMCKERGGGVKSYIRFDVDLIMNILFFDLYSEERTLKSY